MTIRLIIGRAGTGKTATCLDAVREELRRRPTGPLLILLVPEQATFQTEYALASTPGLPGFIRAQVLSFRRMAFRVLQEVGGAARAHIGDLGKRMMLRSLLEKQAAQLKVFRHAAGQPGFTETIASTLSELKSYCVGAEELAATINLLNSTSGTKQLADKLADISLLYNGLEEALKDRYIDPDDYLNLLAEHIEHSEAMRGATVWVDGFSGFTPQEYRVLMALAHTVAQVNITLCSSIESLTGSPVESDPFYPIRETYEKLMDMAAQEKIKVERPLILDGGEKRRHYSVSIAYLEKEFFNLQAAPLDGPVEEVILVSAANPIAEVEGVAREITALCRDQGFYYRDIIIVLREIGAYAELIATIFDDHGIPVFIDQKRPVMHHPLVELIRSALEVLETDWSYNPVFRFLKTDLVPVSREEVDILENYVLAHGIRGSRWIDGTPWKYNRRMTLEEELPVTELEEAELETINQIRSRAVAALANFTKAFNKAANVREQTTALYSLLEELQVPLSLERWSKEAEAEGKLLEAREHLQIWGEIIALLEQVVEAMGDEVMSVEQYAAVMEAGLESMRLGLIPPALDQVVVGSLERSRSPAAKVAFVLGVSDGVLPAKLTGNGVITEAERERLRLYGLQLAPGIRQRLFREQYLVYIALTRARERLYLSSPLADEEGAAIKPSQVMSRVRELLPGAKELYWPVEPDSSLLDDLEFITNQQRSLTYLVTRLREAKTGEKLDPVWHDVYNWFLANKKKDDYARVLSGLFYSNKEDKLPVGVVRSLYGRPLRTSVSGIERFRACPFAHFLSQGLRLRERVEYKLDAPDLGQFFHAALKLFGERVKSKKLTWGQLSDEECKVLSSEVVDLLVPRLQNEILLSSARRRYLTGKLRRIVQRATQTLCEHSRRGQFQPVGLELPLVRMAPFRQRPLHCKTGAKCFFQGVSTG